MITEIRIPTDIVLQQKINQMITEINRLSECVALLLGRSEGFDSRFRALEKKK